METDFKQNIKTEPTDQYVSEDVEMSVGYEETNGHKINGGEVNGLDDEVAQEVSIFWSLEGS